jgi:hypothetical protein
MTVLDASRTTFSFQHRTQMLLDHRRNVQAFHRLKSPLPYKNSEANDRCLRRFSSKKFHKFGDAKWRRFAKSLAYNMVTIFYGLTRHVVAIFRIDLFSTLIRYYINTNFRGFSICERAKKCLATSPWCCSLPILGPKETAVLCHEALPCEFYRCAA